MSVDKKGLRVEILYRNHRGETALRIIEPERIWFGLSAWHGMEAQWFLQATDLERGVERSFACKDILEWRAAT